jgi:hypothetical protein
MMVAKRIPNEREAQVGATVAAANAAGLLSDADLLAGVGRYGALCRWQSSRSRNR